MTKKQAKAHKADWNAAIREGRMVRFPQGLIGFRAYPTPEAARDAVAATKAQGLAANIVDPKLAQ